MKLKNKKGAELNITVIIVIILAVLALVILVIAFTTGFGQLWERIVGIWGSEKEIEESSAVSTCNLHLVTNDKYAFCCATKNIRGRGEISCNALGRARNWAGFDPTPSDALSAADIEKLESFCDEACA